MAETCWSGSTNRKPVGWSNPNYAVVRRTSCFLLRGEEQGNIASVVHNIVWRQGCRCWYEWRCSDSGWGLEWTSQDLLVRALAFSGLTSAVPAGPINGKERNAFQSNAIGRNCILNKTLSVDFILMEVIGASKEDCHPMALEVWTDPEVESRRCNHRHCWNAVDWNGLHIGSV